MTAIQAGVGTLQVWLYDPWRGNAVLNTLHGDSELSELNQVSRDKILTQYISHMLTAYSFCMRICKWVLRAHGKLYREDHPAIWSDQSTGRVTASMLPGLSTLSEQ